jgi:hypothetical protein
MGSEAPPDAAPVQEADAAIAIVETTTETITETTIYIDSSSIRA